MKILIVSDSHGDAERLNSAVLRERPDALLHLGDGASDLTLLDSPPALAAVRGNCDWRSALPEKRLIELGGARIFMTHGHFYGVKQGLMSAALAAEEERADVLAFGHTHVPEYTMRGRLHVLNPGSIRNGSYAVIEAKDEEINCRLKRL